MCSRKIIILLLIFFGVNYSNATVLEKNQRVDDFISLLNSPESFHEKIVKLQGIYLFGLDLSTLYPSVSDYNNDNFENSVSIELQEGLDKEKALFLTNYHGKCVTVMGTFDANTKGYGGYNKGMIYNVISIGECKYKAIK